MCRASRTDTHARLAASVGGFRVNEPTLNGHLCRLVGELVKQGISLQQASREFERQYLLAALRAHAGSLSRSASSLGVHRNTLRNKMSALGIESDDITPRPRPRRRRTVSRLARASR